MFKVPEKYRVKRGAGHLNSTKSFGNNGVFLLRRKGLHKALTVVASDKAGWEHVSISLPSRCPTWKEMNFVKKVFWDGEDCVVQYHPPESNYVNCHTNTLHLWRPKNKLIPQPPSILVGLKAI